MSFENARGGCCVPSNAAATSYLKNLRIQQLPSSGVNEKTNKLEKFNSKLFTKWFLNAR